MKTVNKRMKKVVMKPVKRTFVIDVMEMRTVENWEVTEVRETVREMQTMVREHGTATLFDSGPAERET